MEPQKPDDQPGFGRCNAEYGIELYVDGNTTNVVRVLKQLKAQGEDQSWGGSVDQFLLGLVRGYHDVRNVSRGEYDSLRTMETLPKVCGDCEAQGRCYDLRDRKYFKKRFSQS